MLKNTIFKTALVAGLLTAGLAHAADKAKPQAPEATSDKPATAAGKSIASESFADRKSNSNAFWWPERLDLAPLRQFGVESDPMGKDYDYVKEFKKLDLKAVKKDIADTLKNSQEWWPADYGTYAPFFIRMAWHSAGTYRIVDGRGGAASGQQRFEPLNSWPDNVSLDKARRLLWPVKAKYGAKLSWADMMILAGNVSLESMGFKTFGYSGGRRDAWEADLVYWGPEKKFMADDRRLPDGKIKGQMGATQMGLIYVNPEGPNGNPDPALAAKDIRDAFGKMAMDDEEVVALIAGGHSFGKAHGAHDPAKCVEAAPAGAPIEQQGLGWKSKCGTGNGKDTISSGLEGAWTATPTQFSMMYLSNLYAFEWVKTKSPAGATQWVPKNNGAANTVPDAHDPNVKHQPIMFTTDLALKTDPSYDAISKKFLANPKSFEEAFGRAWFKLTHRDMGPRARYVGSEVPKEELIWQDPIPTAKGAKLSDADYAGLKKKIALAGITTPELVRTAWAAAASFRGTDKRGGANGGRLRLAPEKDWAVNNPAELQKVLPVYEKIQAAFNKGGKKVSMADLIVLGGVVGVEQAAKAGGLNVKVPFVGGRTDSSQEQTDVASFAVLEQKGDGFRNYWAEGNYFAPLDMLVERANMLQLSVPEMTVLIGGLRVLGNNAAGSKAGVFTNKVGVLSNDFFVNLLDMGTVWKKSDKDPAVYEGTDRKSGSAKWTATPVDLIFGSHSELRAVAEVYGAADGKQKFAKDFVAAWNKVMNLDRFDLKMAKN